MRSASGCTSAGLDSWCTWAQVCVTYVHTVAQDEEATPLKKVLQS